MATPAIITKLALVLNIIKDSGRSSSVSFVTDVYTRNGKKCGEYQTVPTDISLSDVDEVFKWIWKISGTKFYYIQDGSMINISNVPTESNCRMDQETVRLIQEPIDAVFYRPNNISDLEDDLVEIKKLLPGKKISVTFDY